jgi:hypothetical protein
LVLNLVVVQEVSRKNNRESAHQSNTVAGRYVFRLSVCYFTDFLIHCCIVFYFFFGAIYFLGVSICDTLVGFSTLSSGFINKA